MSLLQFFFFFYFSWVFCLSFILVNTRKPHIGVLCIILIFFLSLLLLFFFNHEYTVFIFLQIYVGGIAVLFGCSVFFVPLNFFEFDFKVLYLKIFFQICIFKFFFVFSPIIFKSFVKNQFYQSFNINFYNEITVYSELFNLFGYTIAILSILLFSGMLIVISFFLNSNNKSFLNAVN